MKWRREGKNQEGHSNSCFQEGRGRENRERKEKNKKKEKKKKQKYLNREEDGQNAGATHGDNEVEERRG